MPNIGPGAAASAADTLTGKVVKITDGDTLYVLDANYEQHKIRLAGIDAPERKQAYGLASRKHLASLVAGKQVTVERLSYVMSWHAARVFEARSAVRI